MTGGGQTAEQVNSRRNSLHEPWVTCSGEGMTVTYEPWDIRLAMELQIPPSPSVLPRGMMQIRATNLLRA
jgi:hypothetical protein